MCRNNATNKTSHKFVSSRVLFWTDKNVNKAKAMIQHATIVSQYCIWAVAYDANYYYNSMRLYLTITLPIKLFLTNTFLTDPAGIVDITWYG